MTKGEWNSRIKNISNIFPKLANLFQETIIFDLEYIRKCRNRIGHKFGLDLKSYEYRAILKEIGFINISLTRMKKSLEIVYDTAKLIDENIKSNELLLFEFFIFLINEFLNSQLSDAYLHPHIQNKIRQKIGQRIGHSLLSKEDFIKILQFYSNHYQQFKDNHFLKFSEIF